LGDEQSQCQWSAVGSIGEELSAQPQHSNSPFTMERLTILFSVYEAATHTPVFCIQQAKGWYKLKN
jgi:hypothetical protein